MVFAAWAFYVTLRFNLHMLQLNGYDNEEHGTWLKNNRGKQRQLIFMLFCGVMMAIYSAPVTAIISIIFLVIDIRIYLFLKSVFTKKKLVMTTRAKRLVFTSCILLAVLVALGEVCENFFHHIGGMAAALIGIFLAPYILMLANIINRPAEKAVRQWYINDAKRVLKENSHIKIIGITGSYGKTSVKFYLNTLLSARYNVLVTPESYNTPMGVVKTIREQMKSSHEIFVCEMGARKVGEIKEICDIVHPRDGLITSIGPQHLETFFNMDNIVKTKFELGDALPEGGILFLNGDNEYITDNMEKNGSRYPNTVMYGEEVQTHGYHTENVKVSDMGTTFIVVAPDGEKAEFTTRLIGAHNVINVLGAIAVAHTYGIPLSELKVPVRRLQPAEHRLQLIDHGNVAIIDDTFNSNPIGSKAAVEMLALFEGTRILITPGMVELGEKEEEYNFKYGTYAAECCDYIFLVGVKRTKPIYDGILSKGFDETRVKAVDTLQDAMKLANALKTDKKKYILLENDLPDNY
ncbi:MAG: UDP-N-acetylmuramoyl-tripeptide--D-alanyl-D-alanine ligase [Lachnospiraceae bacterium]|nr:UDP-N-acetylmuramoyl-tripeptide--D-alanyl-D-alanine ligase [Lachnospiraceae bacterium]